MAHSHSHLAHACCAYSITQARATQHTHMITRTMHSSHATIHILHTSAFVCMACMCFFTAHIAIHLLLRFKAVIVIPTLSALCSSTIVSFPFSQSCSSCIPWCFSRMFAHSLSSFAPHFSHNSEGHRPPPPIPESAQALLPLVPSVDEAVFHSNRETARCLLADGLRSVSVLSVDHALLCRSIWHCIGAHESMYFGV